MNDAPEQPALLAELRSENEMLRNFNQSFEADQRRRLRVYNEQVAIIKKLRAAREGLQITIGMLQEYRFLIQKTPTIHVMDKPVMIGNIDLEVARLRNFLLT